MSVLVFVPLMRVPSSAVARYELNRLTTIFTYLQQKALLTGSTITMTCNMSCFHADTTHELTKPWYFGVLPGIKGPPSRPKKELTTGDACFIIQDGRISSGSLYLTDGVSQYALTVDAADKVCIRSYWYNGTWQQLS